MAATPLTELVKAARDGDEDAFVELIERFAGVVFALTRSFRLSRADAVDVSQAVWLRLSSNLPRIERPEAIGAWIRTTARHECLALLRRNREVPVDFADDAADELAPPLDVGLIADERHRALWEAFSSLPTRCQALLRLLLTDPEPRYSDIAATLGMSRGSIGPTRRRCIEKLQAHPAVARIRDPDDGSSPS